MENSIGMISLIIKDNGMTTNSMDKGKVLIIKIKNISENFKVIILQIQIIKNMGLEHNFVLMVKDILETGNMEKKMEKVYHLMFMSMQLR